MQDRILEQLIGKAILSCRAEFLPWDVKRPNLETKWAFVNVLNWVVYWIFYSI